MSLPVFISLFTPTQFARVGVWVQFNIIVNPRVDEFDRFKGEYVNRVDLSSKKRKDESYRRSPVSPCRFRIRYMVRVEQ